MSSIREVQTDGWYEISPDDARVLLAKKATNRPLRKDALDQLVAAIKAGEWMPNGESIILDREGRLLDGQHRLAAIEKTGVTCQSMVVRVAETNGRVMDTIDQGVARTPSDVLAMDGVPHHRLAAILSKFLLAYESSGHRASAIIASTPTTKAIHAYYVTHSGVINDAVTGYVGLTKKHVAAQPSLVVFVFCRAMQVNTVLAHEWLDGLMSGANLEHGSPVLALRSLLLANARATRKMGTKHQLAVLIKSWLALEAGKSITHLRWRSSGPKPEAFPEFSDK